MKTLLSAVALCCAALPAQNQALTFTNGGADTHFDVAYAPGLLPRRALTVEAWITYDDATVPTGTFRYPTVARQDVAPGGESWFLRIGAANTGNRSLEWACHNGSSLQFLTYQFQPGEFLNWTHVAGTYDGSVATLCINGVEVSRRAVFGNLRDNQGLLRVGNGDVSSPGAEVWNGEIDELRIWPYAKTEAEILESFNDEMGQVPGALTFNLDGNVTDSSSNFAGAATGTLTFVPGASMDPWSVMGAIRLGTPSTTCSQELGITVSNRPVGGSPNFACVSYDGSASVSGGLLIAAGPANLPVQILGVDVLLDLNTLLPIQVLTSTDASGVARAPLTLPSNPSLAGASLAGQFVFIDAACGSQGLTASPVLGIVLQF